MLLARVAAGVDAIDLQFLIRDERGDELALSGMWVEAPAVVATLELSTVEMAAGQRHAAVWAGILQSKREALRITSQNERDLEEHGFCQVILADAIAGQCAIPEAGEHQRVRGLALGRIVEHGLRGGYYRHRRRERQVGARGAAC